jgi:hypothetical protein
MNKLRSNILLLLTCTALSIAGCSSSGSSDDDKDPIAPEETVKISTTLSTEQETPAVEGAGTGNASIEIGKKSGAISGSLTVSGLTGDVSAAHIHSGVAGKNGAVIFALKVGENNTLTIPDGTVLDADQLAAMLAGKTYFNVHTTANPSGEIRGQIIPSTHKLIRVTLNGDNTIPQIPNETTATGVGYITVNTTGKREIVGNFTTTNLDNATAAHIHKGLAGTAGGVLTSFAQDSTDPALWTLANDATLTEEDLGTLNEAGLYINVHSQTNQAGEIRGQIVPEGITIIRAVLSGDQQIPTAIVTTGSGIAYATLNTNNGEIHASLTTTDLSSSATAAHIHQGAAGANGGVITSLVQDTTNSAIWATEASAVLSAEQITAFAAGETYFNVHTQTNGGGELRGQITP